mmetsp:Transcript_66166/g.173490  ORF Transcript_66166/g.173490 Transcript_66166/m.173490 type:complete len:193 (-) Transcript_66166:38-616(-)
MAAKPPRGPVFLENPDGSLAQGVPFGHRERTPPGTPRRPTIDPVQRADIVRVLARQEALFLALLAMQLMVEVFFEKLHIEYREDAVFELSLTYTHISFGVLWALYWLGIFAEVLYSTAYLALGVLAAARGKPQLYSRFSTVALFGTLAQLPLAYLNRFNLLIFFLRFISYAYARFHMNLLYGIRLLAQDAPP